MYRTAITLVVLSEDEIPEGMDVGDVVREYDTGDYVLFSTDTKAEKLTDEEMAEALTQAGSEPDFFQLGHLA